MDQILRINMSAKGGPVFKKEAAGKYAGMGGRALTSAVIAEEVPPMAHPLGDENKLVIAPGLLSGSTAASPKTTVAGMRRPAASHAPRRKSGSWPRGVA